MLVPALGACKSRPNSLRAGYVKVLVALPFMFAHRQGLFQQAGLQVDVTEFGNSNDAATAGVTRAVDFIGAGATNACLDAMTAANSTLTLFTMNDYVRRPNLQSTDFLLSLAQFKTIESLRGQPVAFFPGSFGKMFARLILPTLGLRVEDVQYVEMQPPQWLAALKSGAVKAVTALEPVASKIMASMKVNVLVDGYYASVMQRVPASGSWFLKGHLERATEQKIHDSMMEAVRILSSDRPRAVAAIQELFSLEKAVAEQVRMPEWRSSTNADGRAALNRFGQLLAARGGIQRPPPPNGSWIWA
ncbi:MAG TPA: ABC transporter substrate-binding protein [Allosphingosinicella sp.]